MQPGDFAENITTEGLDLLALPVGTRMRIGSDVIGEVSQIGKECHTRCAIFYQAGDCVMPKEGIFIRILKGGKVRKGDKIDVSLRLPETDSKGVMTVSSKEVNFVSVIIPAYDPLFLFC